MLKRMFGLADKEKQFLKSLGLKDSDLEEIENASIKTLKRNLITFTCVSFVVGIILGKVF